MGIFIRIGLITSPLPKLGQVLEGQNVVEDISLVQRDRFSKPIEDVVIEGSS